MTPRLPRHKISQGPMPAASASPPPLSMRPGRRTFIETCERLRFRGDRPAPTPQRLKALLREGILARRADLLTDGLRVDESNAPDVFELVRACAGRLGLATLPEVYVSPDPLHQGNAFCTSVAPDDQALLMLSSSLFDLLDDAELGFVISHELGHLALHGRGDPSGARASTAIRSSGISQAREISADRVGLIGCGNFDASCRALVKIHCGLGRIASKINVDALLQQAADIDVRYNVGEAFSSHPFLPVRVWALTEFHRTISAIPADQLDLPAADGMLAKLDHAVEGRLAMRGGGTAAIARANAVSSARLWLGILWLGSLPDAKLAAGEKELRRICDEVALPASLRVLRECGIEEVVVRTRSACVHAMASDPDAGQELMDFVDGLSARCGLNVKATEAWIVLDELMESARDCEE